MIAEGKYLGPTVPTYPRLAHVRNPRAPRLTSDRDGSLHRTGISSDMAIGRGKSTRAKPDSSGVRRRI